MTSDPAAWIAAEAGFPLLEESNQGRIRVNDAGLALLRGRSWRDLVDAALVIIGAEDDRSARATIRRLVETARRPGARVSDRAGRGGWLCLGTCQRDGRARLVLVPAATTRTAELEREASAVHLAAEVSHEVANALGAISGLARQAREAGSMKDARGTFGLIESRAVEAQATSRKLLATVRGDDPADGHQPGDEAVTDVGGLLQEIRELLGPLTDRAGVRVDLMIEPGVSVRAPRSDLFTIAWNLAKNAVEALGGSGRIELEARGSEDGARAILRVSDDGPGIAAANMPRLFEPYYTTKDHGTGLGLPLVRRTVEELGGHLGVESNPGAGTRFTVQLPMARSSRDDLGFDEERTSGPESIVQPTRRPQTGMPGNRRESGVLDRPLELSARILVLDDDAPVREVLQTTLELRGAYVVVGEAPTPSVLAQGPYDVAIVDQNLGALRGDAVLAELKATRRVRRGVLMTGGSMPPGFQTTGPAPDGWLRKPFEPDEAVGVLRRLLEADGDLTGRTGTGH